MASNEVGFATSTGLISRQDLKAALVTATQQIPQVGGDFQFLKMDKGTGDWVYGQTETLVSAASLWAVNPLSLSHGWVCWDSDAGGPPVEEVMVSAIQHPTLPNKSTLPPVGNGVKGKPLQYQQQRGVQMVCVLDPEAEGNDTDVGVQVEYKQSSIGAQKAFAALTNAILARVAKDETAIVPIIRLRNERYKHDTYGWIQNPIFDIVEWRDMNDATPPSADADTDDGADDNDAKLAAMYEAEKTKAAPAEAEAPRRRTRR